LNTKKTYYEKVFLIIAILFALKSNAQTITNNTNCDIRVDVLCQTTQPGCWFSTIAGATIPAGGSWTYPICTPNVSFKLVLHIWFRNCPLNDPYIGLQGNCLNAPTDDVMYSCDDQCSTGTITYLGGPTGYDWEIN